MDKAYRNLAEAIILKAVEDWRDLYKPKKNRDKRVSHDEIRAFFNSEWGETLCGKVNPKMILDRLEIEREEQERMVNEIEPNALETVGKL